MRDVDRTLSRENLKLTPGERLEKFARFAAFAATLREAGKRAAGRPKGLESLAELQALLEEEEL